MSTLGRPRRPLRRRRCGFGHEGELGHLYCGLAEKVNSGTGALAWLGRSTRAQAFWLSREGQLGHIHSGLAEKVNSSTCTLASPRRSTRAHALWLLISRMTVVDLQFTWLLSGAMWLIHVDGPCGWPTKVSLLLSSSHLIFSAFSNLISSYPLQSVSNQVGMASSGSSSDVRFVPFVRSRGTSLGNLKANTSGSSSGVPSPIDAKSLRNLDVMKACHDIDSIVTEESLDAIQQCYSILGEYALRAPLPKQHPYNPSSSELSISVDALEAGLRFSLHPLIEECLGWWRISSSQDAEDVYRETYFSTPSYQFTTGGRGGSCGTRIDSDSGCDPEKVYKESTVSSEELAPHVYQRPKSMKDLCRTAIRKNDEGYNVLHMVDLSSKDLDSEKQADGQTCRIQRKYGMTLGRCDPEQVAAVEQWASAAEQQDVNLQTNNGKLMAQLVEVTQRMELSNKELNDVRADLTDAQRQLKEQRSGCWKVNDDLSKAVKEIDALKVELPKKSIVDNKESVRFRWGLRRMG
ncbi:hypothetical protein B296_00020713 [Ensete ventricosum]|uniref:Uncharacterized protein n=1 Tax=Ensete ventricosum TaxID=4639 RepID=A0A427AFE3_ENSVE|nr:hypothetical protein B296_00020713 [Ensete ventricosum]